MSFEHSSARSELDPGEVFTKTSSSLAIRLAPLFAENILAKSYRTATNLTSFATECSDSSTKDCCTVGHPPSQFPEHVPQGGPEAGRYILREPQFWTCGFFPGILYSLLERLTRYPQSIQLSDQKVLGILRRRVSALATLCAEPLRAMAHRTDTHDIGFMIMPAFQKQWELTGDPESLKTILCGAQSLASRFVPSASAIRSWDQRVQKNLAITSQDDNLITIIDSICNLNLLYYAASHGPDHSYLFDIATAHATTLLRTHLRPEPRGINRDATYNGQWYSTFHVANLDPRNGEIKRQFTAQGYSDHSTWARGQAWAILGYAQTFQWTRETRFLDAACGLSEYFLYRLASAPGVPRSPPDGWENGVGSAAVGHIPPWDFDAPMEPGSRPLQDSSAGAIAANGFLLLCQALTGLGDHQLAGHYRDAAIDIAEGLLNYSLASAEARFTTNGEGSIGVEDTIKEQRFEGLLKNGTANNNEHAMKRYADHGLVYGDYYLVELGNKLLCMGIV